MAVTKYQAFKLKRVKRSEINPAPYNPRQMDAHARKLLGENIKKNGLVIPLTLNVRTGNLVAGHQRLRDIDLKEGYPKSGDYEMDVAIVDIDEKAEKELNIFLNNPNAQGSFDNELLAKLFSEGGVSLENTGFNEVDLGILLDSADLGIGSASAGTDTAAVADQEILAGQAELAKQTAPEPRKEITPEEREKLRATKAALKAKPENDTGFYLTVIFKDGDTRKKFLEQLKLPEVEQYVSGQTLMDVLFENATS
jgi:ParB-like chromosome segregation protein Spo0J